MGTFATLPAVRGWLVSVQVGPREANLFRVGFGVDRTYHIVSGPPGVAAVMSRRLGPAAAHAPHGVPLLLPQCFRTFGCSCL